MLMWDVRYVEETESSIFYYGKAELRILVYFAEKSLKIKWLGANTD